MPIRTIISQTQIKAIRINYHYRHYHQYHQYIYILKKINNQQMCACLTV